MTFFTGTVQCIMIGDDYGFTTLAGQGTQETFILWSGVINPPPGAPPAPEPPARVRIMQSDWVALLRQAMATNTPVTIETQTEGQNSAFVLHLQIGAT